MNLKRAWRATWKTAALPILLLIVGTAALWDATRGLRRFLREWYE